MNNIIPSIHIPCPYANCYYKLYKSNLPKIFFTAGDIEMASNSRSQACQSPGHVIIYLTNPCRVLKIGPPFYIDRYQLYHAKKASQCGVGVPVLFSGTCYGIFTCDETHEMKPTPFNYMTMKYIPKNLFQFMARYRTLNPNNVQKLVQFMKFNEKQGIYHGYINMFHILIEHQRDIIKRYYLCDYKAYSIQKKWSNMEYKLRCMGDFVINMYAWDLYNNPNLKQRWEEYKQVFFAKRNMNINSPLDIIWKYGFITHLIENYPLERKSIDILQKYHDDIMSRIKILYKSNMNSCIPPIE